MKKTVLTVTCMFLFSAIAGVFFINDASAENTGADLTLDEGKKYVYFLDSSAGANYYSAFYVTEETSAFWKGASVDVSNTTLDITAFKLYKNNLSLYTSSIDEIANVLEDNVSYSKVDGPSGDLMVNFLPIVLQTEGFGFDFDELKDKGSYVGTWGGTEQVNLSLENLSDCQGYKAYKLTASKGGTYSTYNFSRVEPYLLINWFGSSGLFTLQIDLQSVETQNLIMSEYNNFINSSRGLLNESYKDDTDDETDDDKENNTEDNNETDDDNTTDGGDDKDDDTGGIPGFELLLLLIAATVATIWKKRRKH